MTDTFKVSLIFKFNDELLHITDFELEMRQLDEYALALSVERNAIVPLLSSVEYGSDPQKSLTVSRVDKCGEKITQ